MKPKTQLRTVLLPRTRGQAAIVIALSMIVLIAIVGLAIDGGSVYAQRRNAQNTSDAAALAATRVMLTYYDQMILAYAWDVDYGADTDTAINNALTTYATQHGIPRSSLEAYYVNDNKQLVVTTQVGSTGYVPWVEGAKGIVVKSRGETDSFFMRVFGWNKVGASATSSAFMGIAVDSGAGIPVLPVGFFTGTNQLNNLTIGQSYTLIDGDSRYTSGNWGYIDFNGVGGSASTTNAWLACGFNPIVQTADQWRAWTTAQNCNPGGNDTHPDGPTLHYMCGDPACSTPGTAIQVPYLKFGVGSDGWWLGGSTGTTNSNCQDLANIVNDTEGKHFMVPIFDNWLGTGTGTYFHLLAIGRFWIDPASNVDCHVNDPGGLSHEHWHIQGTFESLYTAGATGRHGDLRHTSERVVFLDN